jgi:enamine deaminase RidA (YjgF/YER057c/UK114 family)
MIQPSREEEAMLFDRNLQELGLELPELPKPAGNYVHSVRTGNLVFLAGKVPVHSNGKVGADVTIEQAYADARETGLYLLAAIKAELGTLDKVSRVVRVFGMVNAAPDFGDHPKVINGCSDLFGEVFGDTGRHARCAVGMGSLPGGKTVEIEAVFEVAE